MRHSFTFKTYFMFYKLNGESKSSSEGKCDLSSETSNNEFVIASDAMKLQVANYKKIMTEIFQVPEESYFNAIPINVNHLKAFIAKNENNGTLLEACRVYLVKDTTDPTGQDYELLFVPCIPKLTVDNKLNYYEDNLGTTDKSYTFSAKCRRPPGCKEGALLLED